MPSFSFAQTNDSAVAALKAQIDILLKQIENLTVQLQRLQNDAVVLSDKLNIGSRVTATDKLRVRAYANGDIVGLVFPGMTGIITGEEVVLGGYTWVKVRYENGIEGYSAKDWLQALLNSDILVLTSTSTPTSTPVEILTPVPNFHIIPTTPISPPAISEMSPAYSENKKDLFSWGKSYTSPFSVGDKIYAREYITSCNETSETRLKIGPCFGVGGLQKGTIIEGPRIYKDPKWYKGYKVKWDDGKEGWIPMGFLLVDGARRYHSIEVGNEIGVSYFGGVVDIFKFPDIDSEKYIDLRKYYGDFGKVIEGPIYADNEEWWKIEWENGDVGWSARKNRYTIALDKREVAEVGIGKIVVDPEYDTYGRISPGSVYSPMELRVLPSYYYNISGEADAKQKGLVVDGPAEDILGASLYHWWKIGWDDGSEGWARDYDIDHYQEGIEDYYIKRLLTKTIGVGVTSVGTTLSVWPYPHEKATLIASRDSGSKGIIIGGPAISVGGLIMYKVRWSDGIEGWSVGEFLIMDDYDQALSHVGEEIISSGISLSVRETPSVSGNLITSRDSGTRGTILEGPVRADGYLWWKVRWNDEVEGWSVGIQLQKDGDTSVVQRDFLLLEKAVDWLRFGKGVGLAEGVDEIKVRLEPISDSEVIATRTRNDPLGTPLKFNDPVRGHYLSGIKGPVRVFNEGKWWRRINWRQMINYKGQEDVLLLGWTEEDKLTEIVEPLKIGMRVHSTGHNLAIRETPGGKWLGAAYGVGTIVWGPIDERGPVWTNEFNQTWDDTNEYTWWQVKWDVSGTLGLPGETGWSVAKWLEPDYYWTLGNAR